MVKLGVADLFNSASSIFVHKVLHNENVRFCQLSIKAISIGQSAVDFNPVDVRF